MARVLAVDHGDEPLDVEPRPDQQAVDVLSERHAAVEDVGRGGVVVDPEMLLEDGLERVGQRRVADVVQQGGGADQAAFRRRKLAQVGVEQRQPRHAEAVLVARVAPAAGLAVGRRDAGIVDAAEEAHVAQAREGGGRDQAGQERVGAGRRRGVERRLEIVVWPPVPL